MCFPFAQENARRRQGAIIESMHHHGKGVYSGTFSGTLNPALQDRHGRPKRDISTIIHILNDLLCATPAATAGHYRHHHRRQQQLPSTSSTTSAGTAIVTGAATTSACHDITSSGYSTGERKRYIIVIYFTFSLFCSSAQKFVSLIVDTWENCRVSQWVSVKSMLHFFSSFFFYYCEICHSFKSVSS